MKREVAGANSQKKRPRQESAPGCTGCNQTSRMDYREETVGAETAEQSCDLNVRYISTYSTYHKCFHLPLRALTFFRRTQTLLSSWKQVLMLEI